MELYGNESRSLPQKIIIVVLEIFFLFVACRILFNSWGVIIYEWLSLPVPEGNYNRNIVNFAFSCIIFLRFSFMMFFLLKRKIPAEEAISIPFAFSLYYIGFALFTIDSNIFLQGVDYAGIVLFAIGCFINTFSELQRHQWKKRPENKGKLYTEGLFRYAMHINYLGDVMWVIGYAIISRNIWAWTIPAFLFGFFVFYNIPKLDEHLKRKYGHQFDEYISKTKRFIPFIY